jgi:hypothetical protein
MYSRPYRTRGLLQYTVCTLRTIIVIITDCMADSEIVVHHGMTRDWPCATTAAMGGHSVKLSWNLFLQCV